MSVELAKTWTGSFRGVFGGEITKESARNISIYIHLKYNHEGTVVVSVRSQPINQSVNSVLRDSQWTYHVI